MNTESSNREPQSLRFQSITIGLKSGSKCHKTEKSDVVLWPSVISAVLCSDVRHETRGAFVLRTAI
jgi:hypothetical protein